MRFLARALILVPALVVARPCGSPATAAPPADGPEVLGRLAEDQAAGRIDIETRLLETFRYAFAPERADARYAPVNRTPLKCLTAAIAEYRENGSRLSAAAVREIEGYLHPPRSGLRATYVSPSGRFSFAYSTTGANAVPSEDVNPANGVPDFVERCAEYMDTSWDTEITNLGFVPPVLPGDGTYDVDFLNMGAYGFTSPAGPGKTTITLENDFVGFPPNSDPDGNQLGAAKVTCAHEFKHASQYATSSWSEGGWVELDATWVEDIVFDATNDYYNYINYTFSNSQLSDPWLRLDNGGAGSYEDCLWQHYLSEKHGVQIIVDLWDRRAAHTSENMKTSYQQTQFLYGTEWDLSWPEMYEWCWFTGSRAEPPYGFGEAPSYLRMRLMTSPVSSYPFDVTDDVDQLAAHPYRFNPGTSGMQPQVAFNGEDGHTQFTVSVIVEDPSGVFTITRPVLDGASDFQYTVPALWDDVLYVGVIVTNTKRSGGLKNYNLRVTEVSGATDARVAAAAAPGRIELRPAAPNPFAASTRIGLALPREMRAVVRILDVAGRTVRILHEGTLPAGESEFVWDGLDRSGRRVPAGVYWARVETAEGSVARKILAPR